jgi:hypothetical protein
MNLIESSGHLAFINNGSEGTEDISTSDTHNNTYLGTHVIFLYSWRDMLLGWGY